MRLYLLNQIEFISFWGYLQLTQFYVQNSNPITNFHSSFTEFKNSDLFTQSKAFSKTSNTDSDIKNHFSSSFGRHYFDSLSAVDYKGLRYIDFLKQLNESIGIQKEYYSLKNPFFSAEVIALENEIMPMVIKMIAQYDAYYMMERSDNDIGGLGTGIWDYFQNFIVFDSKDQIIIRVDMGRD